ncbi:MAG: hypothetical protein CMJ78_10540 [Planctomycetaceae bacterium]|nr:hypothetical protein [Planctomycetaceae bacterium]
MKLRPAGLHWLLLVCLSGCASFPSYSFLGGQKNPPSHSSTASEMLAEASRLAARADMDGANRLAERARALQSSGRGGGQLSYTKPPSSRTKPRSSVNLASRKSTPKSSTGIGGRSLPRVTQTSFTTKGGNPKTIALLQRELKTLPPAERQQLIDEWKDLEPEMVALFIKNRRATGKLKSKPSPPGSRNNIAKKTKSAQDVIGQGGQLTAPPPNRSKGLGTVTPWSTDVAFGHSNPGSEERVAGARTGQSQFVQTGLASTSLPEINANGQRGIRSGTNPVQFAGDIQLDVGVPEPLRSIKERTASVAIAPSESSAPDSIASDRNGNPLIVKPASISEAIDSDSAGPSLSPAVVTQPTPTASSDLERASVDNALNPKPRNGIAALELPETNNLGVRLEDAANPGDLLERLIAQAEDEVAQLQFNSADTDTLIRKHVDLRMLYLISGQQEKTLQAIPIPEPVDQEFWQQMFWAMSNYFDKQRMPDNSERASQTVAQLRTAVAKLQSRAKLNLRNVSFCRKITSFGNFEAYDRDEFSPGEPVLLYAEVGNFRSVPTSDGQYRTLLRSTIQIYRDSGKRELVAEIPFAETEDVCSTQRQDYFHSYELSIPKRNISLGPHLLKLTVVDVMSNKASTQTLRFVGR